jgi:hypothetical protein
MSIFINYARTDAREVEVLRRDLEQSGSSVWTDNQLTGGQSWVGRHTRPDSPV